MDNYTEEILLPDVLGDLPGITRHEKEREAVPEMKVPNWIRVFFLLEPRPPEIPRRVVVCGAGKAPSTRKKPRHVFRTVPDSRPEPVVVRKKVKAAKAGLRDRKPSPVVVSAEQVVKLPWVWIPIMVHMEKLGPLKIGHNCHMGKLRGVDILREARSVFRRAGIPVDVKLCGNHGFISLADKN